jgi:hypothetical protein
MGNFLRQAIRDWLNKEDQVKYNVSARDVPIPSDHLRSPCINLSVRSANGGYVVECNYYDCVTDRHQSTLYVLTDPETMYEDLAKIITIESLKK